MKKIYVTRNWKWLENGKNDSRYTLQYFIDNEAADFIATNFPQYTQADYKGIYSLGIQEVYNDTEWFAVIEFDDLTHDEAQLLIWMQDVISFMGITKLSNAAAARSWLGNNWHTKINNTQYEIAPAYTDEITWEVFEAQYLYL